MKHAEGYNIVNIIYGPSECTKDISKSKLKCLSVYLIALFAIFVVIGCIGTPQNNVTNSSSNITSDVVINGSHVAVEYTGMLENGTVFDSSVGRAPLEFTAGAGDMIKGFDDAVIGMRVDGEKTVTIKPEDAYGIYDQTKVIEVSLANIPNGTKVGDTLYAGMISVRVLEIKNTTAMLDANHFLAGKTLIFKIKLIKII